MPRESSELRRLAREYLEDQTEAVDSLELARTVLGVSGGPPQLARRLVAHLLEGAPGFVCESGSRWRYAAPRGRIPSLPHTEFLVLEGTPWIDPRGNRHLLELAGRRLKGSRMGDSLMFRLRPELPSSLARDWPREALPDGELASAPRLRELLPRLLPLLEEAILVSYEPPAVTVPIARTLAAEHGFSLEVRDLSLRRLARRLFPGRRHREPEELAAQLGLSHRASGRARERADLGAEILVMLVERAAAEGVTTAAELLRFQYEEGKDVDMTRLAFDRRWLEELPSSPGVYRIYERDGTLLYIGKAQNLQERVSHYFRRTWQRDEREERILERAYRVEIEECGSELLALLREDKEIRERSPALNVQRQVKARRRPRRADNLAVLLAGPDPRELVVLFHHPPWPLRFLALPEEGRLAGAVRGELRTLVRRVLSEASPAPGPGGSKGPSLTAALEAELEIAGSWIALNRDRIHSVDLGAVSGESDAIALLDRARESFAGSRRSVQESSEGVEYR